MKSKKQKKGGSNTSPYFTDFDRATRLLEILFCILVFLIIISLVIIGPHRLWQMHTEATSRYFSYIQTLIEGDQIEIIVEDGYETPSDSSDDEHGVIQNIVGRTLRQRSPPKENNL
tara:strand:+ start:132 stop:479 length:348 start_codon:yes stop_codon:yes gene_type:complete